MNVGDRVHIGVKEKGYEGLVMPSTKEDILVLKLDSGYNVGFLQAKVKKSVVLEKTKKEEKKNISSLPVDPKKKTIAILHTGGTIASKVDYRTGAVVARYEPKELIANFPELKDRVNIRSRLISNMFSEDIRFGHYNIIAKEAKKEIDNGCDGVLITHGTDTLHYTAAALSFMFERLPVPIILVGAQRSSDRGSSDAATNLLSAVEWMCQTDFAEVGVCMHKWLNDDTCWILPGVKCRKMHSSRRDAFQPVNTIPWGEVDIARKTVHILNQHFQKRSSVQAKLSLFKEDLKIGILKMRPQMYPEEVLFYQEYDGLVLEGTGLGHAPINVVDSLTKDHKKIRDAIEKVAKKIPVVMATQTIYGRVNMDVYSTGRDLQDIGVVGNLHDMTPETTYIKLAWLLSTSPRNTRNLICKNLRGEISDRSIVDFYNLETLNK